MPLENLRSWKQEEWQIIIGFTEIFYYFYLAKK